MATKQPDIQELIFIYNDIKSKHRSDTERAKENFLLYAPTGSYQAWNSSVLGMFAEEDRDPAHYNFMQMYVDGNAGNLFMNKVDPNFVDAGDDDVDTSDALEALKNAWYSDKALFRYDTQFLISVINGCIYQGVEEIKIVRTPDYPLGRIKFEAISPLMMLFDPDVVSDDIARASKRAWKRFYLTPKDIQAFFPDKAKLVEYVVTQNLMSGDGRDAPTVPQSEIWGRKYEVVEYYHIVKEKGYIAYDIGNGVQLPNFDDVEFGSEGDFYKKLDWAVSQGFELHPQNIKEVEHPKEVLYVTTFVPALGIVLQHKKDERQISNHEGGVRLPFFAWSYIRKHGKPIGLIDIGKDMQKDLNKREVTKSKFIEKTPIGGKVFIHPMAVGEDPNRIEEVVENFTDPSKPFILDKDAPPGMRLVETWNGPQLNPVLFQDEGMKINIMDKILRLPPAMQGQPGKSGETGVLFSRKVIEGSIMQTAPNEFLRDYQLQKFDAWVQLAIKIYGGSTEDERIANYNRVFMLDDGKKFIANAFVGVDESGNDIVVNDISKLKRVQVMVVEGKDNAYLKQAKRELDIAFLQAMPPTPTNAGFRAIAEADLVKNMDGITEDQKKQIEEMAELSISLAKMQLLAQVQQLQLQIQQAQSIQQQQQLAALGQVQNQVNNIQGPQTEGEILQ